MVVGLRTGSTTYFAVGRLGELLKSGEFEEDPMYSVEQQRKEKQRERKRNNRKRKKEVIITGVITVPPTIMAGLQVIGLKRSKEKY